ncbi:LacI family DNA-binding transcriptional regulator (plasmid) [Coraliomargarita sp. W4R53]
MTDITLADVAAHAGVSIATASRALSGTRKVSAGNQRSIEKAARELGYRHNPLAGALRTQRSGVIGVILPRFSPGFVSTVVESISTSLDEQQRALTIRYVEQTPNAAVHGIHALRDRRVEGIIVCAPSPDVALAAVGAADVVPLVLVGRHHEAVSPDSVGLDDERAGAMITAHLKSTTAHIFSVGFDANQPADARRQAQLEIAARQHGIAHTALAMTGATLEGGITAGEQYVASSVFHRRGSGHLVPAMVCANDDVAAGFAAVLRMHSVAIPEQVQIASLMDVEFSDSPNRAITTLRHPWSQMGSEAARLLAEIVQGNNAGAQTTRPARRVVLAPTLMIGASTRT